MANGQGLDYNTLWSETDPWASIPDRYNLGRALTRGQVEAGLGEKVCLRWENSAGQTRSYTYRQMDEVSSRLASALSRLGVRRGDRVLLRMPNLAEFYIAALGIAKLGAVFIPSSTQFRASEIAYRLRDSEAIAVITTTPLAGEVREALPTAPSVAHVIAVAYDDVAHCDGELDFWELLSGGDPQFESADTAHDDVAFIAYTSGTTGDPKGVVHYHRYPISYDPLIEHWHDYQPHDVCACPAEVGWLLPVASTFLYSMRAGIETVLYHPIDGRFRAEDWLRLFQKYGITNFTATPTIYRLLIASEHARREHFASLRHGVSAGEPLPPDTIASVKKTMGFEPLDGIGMSECMVYCFNMLGLPQLPGSCGRPSPGTEIRLLDEQMQPVPPGSPGVLCLRRDSHPGMMKEYWRKPEQTAEIFRGEWYYSGDVLEQDSEGRYWFRARADDVINAAGYRISPFEVESCLAEHPSVLESAAVESPDDVRGAVVKVFVVLRESCVADDGMRQELAGWVKENLAPYKYPRRIEFVEALPKTTSGKIKRRLLRDQERQRHEDQRQSKAA